MAQTFLLGLARLAQKYKISLRNSFATISPQKFMLKTILMVLQVAVPILLMACILIQQKGTALGSAFGSEGGATYVKKRGLENKIFWASVVLGALFIIVSLINLLLTV
ncbi:preprotein translocase subunit SecG [bacterium (Candidatus Gribaldobacteria) CG_4_10_14_0_2_um_filter_41_16]|uniref:Protein-export membrane protein SecG n=3 Tax=Candidatus Gribaldobacteria TaxID=2798536 RepID=A0A2M7VIP4_9BACT|nr:MAG: preprotein translocase subunit SecG [bacterium (Candidatus Gribaldobacteria) CG10_big_fil_rev_8_21_14_0_10_41_12]PIX02934.1 MAG: preprotein translocase subunit SecG [bacterium (Candidatus Gribaldobacteria) CG_4_8_14_3_um_filter_42_11]PJA01606.1 MAG: preprotein translocase subunit SecG [bacterium (Candidatus Gribaldobacteria) CG_4_10_14_0_2_um_filter_41_16]